VLRRKEKFGFEKWSECEIYNGSENMRVCFWRGKESKEKIKIRGFSNSVCLNLSIIIACCKKKL
jgi:hypothetical protein